MAKNRKSNDIRKLKRGVLFKTNSSKHGKIIRRKNDKLIYSSGVKPQIIYSEKLYIFKERYITDHMLEKAIRLGLTKKEALEKYGKNRYILNPNAKPIKVINHKF